MSRPPIVVPDADWIPVDPLNLEASGRRSFVSGGGGLGEGDRLRVAYFRREGHRGLVGRAWFGPGAEGPPRHAHGGSVAAVLDEAMGSAAWQEDLPVVAGHLATDFRRMVPLGIDARFEAAVERIDGRKVYTAGRLTDDDGRLLAEATAIFIRLKPEQLEAFRQQLDL
jgi:acyl-coenzyme A thioesterase PaaI-like protein